MSSASSKLYTDELSKYYGVKSKAITDGTFQYDFTISEFGSIKDYLMKTEVSDLLSEMLSAKPNGVTIEDWAPKKSEAFHAGHLEKAMRIRYSGYDTEGKSNVSALYQTAAKDQMEKSTMSSQFGKLAFNWNQA